MSNTSTVAPVADTGVAMPLIPVIDWVYSYYDTPTTAALRRAADGLGAAVFASRDRTTRIEQIEALVGYTLVQQICRDGNPGKAQRVTSDFAEAVGPARRALAVFRNAMSAMCKLGVKTPLGSVQAVSQECFVEIVKLLVDAAQLRAFSQIARLTSSGLTPEQAAEKIKSAKADKADKAFAEKAKMAGYIAAADVVTFNASESAECMRLQGLLDEAEGARVSLAEQNKGLRLRVTELAAAAAAAPKRQRQRAAAAA